LRTAAAVVAACWCTVFLVVASYRYGMFFDVDFYLWEGLLAISGCVAIVGMAIWRRNRMETALVQTQRYGTAMLLGPLAMALLYGISLLDQPASVQGTAEQAVRWMAYGALAWCLHSWLQLLQGRVWLKVALQISGAVIVWGALFGWLGWSRFSEIVLITHDRELSASGARLSGFFQYPNMLGAITAAFLCWQWVWLTRERSWAMYVTAAVQVLPVALVLLLTESRGAWLAGAGGWLAGWWLIGRGYRIRWLLHSGWTMLAAAAAYRIALPAGVRSIGGHGWQFGDLATLLGIGLVMVCGLILLGSMKERIARIPSWCRGGAGVILLAGAVLLLVSSVLQGRLTEHYETAASRAIFYRDGLQLFLDAPMLGHGGKAWHTLFKQFQSQPYVGSEVHSGYLDGLLELGLIGGLLATILLIAILLPIWRSQREGLVPLTVLLLHAAIDFDMSYGYFWLLFISWAMLYSAPITMPVQAQHQAQPQVQRNPQHKDNLRYLAPIAFVLFAATALTSWQWHEAWQLRKAAVSMTAESREVTLRGIISRYPYWSRIRLELVPLVPAQERASLLNEGLRYEPQSADLLWAIAMEAVSRLDVPQASAAYQAALRHDRFNRDRQTESIQQLNGLAIQLQQIGRLDAARQAVRAALAIYEDYDRLAGLTYRANGRRFAMTSEAEDAAEESKALLLQLG